MDEPIGNNGLVEVAQEQIAAKLNIANGASDDCIRQTIMEVDALIDGLVIPPVGDGFIPLGNVEGFYQALVHYNKGETCCAEHCNDDPQERK